MYYLIITFVLYLFVRGAVFSSKYNKKLKMLMLFGSGGHTGEMLMTFKDFEFQERCQHVYLMHSSADPHEPSRVLSFFQNNKIVLPSSEWLVIPRSRKVKQSLVSSVWTTLYAFVVTFMVLLRHRDIDLFVTNGPGTSIPVMAALLVQYGLFMRKRCKILFLESWCRVEGLSMSGKIAQWLSDLLVVHWRSLHEKEPRSSYFGNLI